MSGRLRTVLKEFVGPAGALGGAEADRKALQKALNGLIRSSRAMLWIAVGMALALFLAELAVALVKIDNPKIVAGMAGAMGLTGAGAIDVIRRISRDMAQTHLLIVLSGSLDTEALKPVIAALARKL